MRNAPGPSEAQLHATVTEYLALARRPGVVCHHSPNEGRRGWKAQGDLKKNGVRKGWPDIEIIADGRAYFIELKRKGAKPTTDQLQCHCDLARAGCEVKICQSFETVEATVKGWGLTR